jgi:DNA-binding FadR family transcriptional regulator
MTRVVAMGLSIVRARLSDSLVTYYACEIVGGRIGAGEPLPSEPSIAAQFGVSKQIVREALQVLAALGMVAVQHGKRTVGLFEPSWDVLDLRVQQAFHSEGRGHELEGQLREARAILEMSAARLAARRATEADVAALNSLVEEMSGLASGTRDLITFLGVDRAFHERVAEASANGPLRRVIREVHGFLGSAWTTSTIDGRELPDLVEMHSRIAAAIANGDAEGAAEAVHIHLTRAADRQAATGSPRTGRGAGSAAQCTSVGTSSEASGRARQLKRTAHLRPSARVPKSKPVRAK